MPRQPVFNIPSVVTGLIGMLALVQAVRAALPAEADARLLAATAFVPARLTFAVAPDRVAAALQRLAQADGGQDGAAVVGLFFLGNGSLQPWTLLSYALLHGDWTHLGLNAIWLLAFGAPVARRLGGPRFLMFCAAGAVAGAVVHWGVDITSLQPLVGASAAVSACMGAAARFAFRAPLGPDGTPSEAGFRLSLAATFRDPRARAFLLVWFAVNLVTGLLAVPLGLSDFPIAWQAHVGGLLVGLLALPIFDRRRTVTPPASRRAA